MTAVITIGMWAHALLVMSLVYSRFQTRNPIWGELVSAAAAVPVFALWIMLDRSLS